MAAKPKEPLIALMLTCILTGLGQVYAGRLKRGILFFSIPLVFLVAALAYIISPNTKLNIYFASLIPLLIAFKIFVFIDAYRLAKAYNISNNLQRSITDGKRIVIIAGILLFFILNPGRIAASYIRANLFQAFRIRSASMSPALLEGDSILVDKSIYNKTEPRRGDVIAFIYPVEKGRIFAQRIAGLPGDTMEINNGLILINGVTLKEPEVFKNVYYYNKGDFAQEGKSVKIPEDNYFVLGDNSSLSKDSRYWGFVPKKYLIGKAYKIYFPFNRSGLIK